jgi:hypothetical protein
VDKSVNHSVSGPFLLKIGETESTLRVKDGMLESVGWQMKNRVKADIPMNAKMVEVMRALELKNGRAKAIRNEFVEKRVEYEAILGEDKNIKR